MYNRSRLLTSGVALCILIALSSCGTAGMSGSGTPPGNPVDINTDHTTYQASDVMQVSITNNMQTSIFAYDNRASCTVLDLQVQVNGIWQNSKASRCARASLPKLIEIAAGKTYHVAVSAGTPGVQSAGFPGGTYRFALRYTTSSGESNQSIATSYSAPIVVV